jgi:hypothetical protein
MIFVTFFKEEFISDSVHYLMQFTILFSHIGAEHGNQVLLLFFFGSSSRRMRARLPIKGLTSLATSRRHK